MLIRSPYLITVTVTGATQTQARVSVVGLRNFKVGVPASCASPCTTWSASPSPALFVCTPPPSLPSRAQLSDKLSAQQRHDADSRCFESYYVCSQKHKHSHTHTQYRSPHMGPMRLNVMSILLCDPITSSSCCLLLVGASVDRAVHHRPIS